MIKPKKSLKLAALLVLFCYILTQTDLALAFQDNALSPALRSNSLSGRQSSASSRKAPLKLLPSKYNAGQELRPPGANPEKEDADNEQEDIFVRAVDKIVDWLIASFKRLFKIKDSSKPQEPPQSKVVEADFDTDYLFPGQLRALEVPLSELPGLLLNIFFKKYRSKSTADELAKRRSLKTKDATHEGTKEKGPPFGERHKWMPSPSGILMSSMPLVAFNILATYMVRRDIFLGDISFSASLLMVAIFLSMLSFDSYCGLFNSNSQISIADARQRLLNRLRESNLVSPDLTDEDIDRIVEVTDSRTLGVGPAVYRYSDINKPGKILITKNFFAADTKFEKFLFSALWRHEFYHQSQHKKRMQRFAQVYIEDSLPGLLAEEFGARRQELAFYRGPNAYIKFIVGLITLPFAFLGALSDIPYLYMEYSKFSSANKLFKVKEEELRLQKLHRKNTWGFSVSARVDKVLDHFSKPELFNPVSLERLYEECNLDVELILGNDYLIRKFRDEEMNKQIDKLISDYLLMKKVVAVKREDGSLGYVLSKSLKILKDEKKLISEMHDIKDGRPVLDMYVCKPKPASYRELMYWDENTKSSKIIYVWADKVTKLEKEAKAIKTIDNVFILSDDLQALESNGSSIQLYKYDSSQDKFIKEARYARNDKDWLTALGRALVIDEDGAVKIVYFNIDKETYGLLTVFLGKFRYKRQAMKHITTLDGLVILESLIEPLIKKGEIFWINEIDKEGDFTPSQLISKGPLKKEVKDKRIFKINGTKEQGILYTDEKNLEIAVNNGRIVRKIHRFGQDYYTDEYVKRMARQTIFGLDEKYSLVIVDKKVEDKNGEYILRWKAKKNIEGIAARNNSQLILKALEARTSYHKNNASDAGMSATKWFNKMLGSYDDENNISPEIIAALLLFDIPQDMRGGLGDEFKDVNLIIEGVKKLQEIRYYELIARAEGALDEKTFRAADMQSAVVTFFRQFVLENALEEAGALTEARLNKLLAEQLQLFILRKYDDLEYLEPSQQKDAFAEISGVCAPLAMQLSLEKLANRMMQSAVELNDSVKYEQTVNFMEQFLGMDYPGSVEFAKKVEDMIRQKCGDIADVRILSSAKEPWSVVLKGKTRKKQLEKIEDYFRITVIADASKIGEIVEMIKGQFGTYSQERKYRQTSSVESFKISLKFYIFHDSKKIEVSFYTPEQYESNKKGEAAGWKYLFKKLGHKLYPEKERILIGDNILDNASDIIKRGGLDDFIFVIVRVLEDESYKDVAVRLKKGFVSAEELRKRLIETGEKELADAIKPNSALINIFDAKKKASDLRAAVRLNNADVIIVKKSSSGQYKDALSQSPGASGQVRIERKYMKDYEKDGKRLFSEIITRSALDKRGASALRRKLGGNHGLSASKKDIRELYVLIGSGQITIQEIQRLILLGASGVSYSSQAALVDETIARVEQLAAQN